MEKSERGVGEQFVMYADKHYFASKVSLDEQLGKVLRDVQECY